MTGPRWTGRDTYLYHVLDDTGRIRYVGRSVNPYGRMISHICSRNICQHAFAKWLKKTIDAGTYPSMIVVAINADELDEEREIVRLIERGEPILNAVNRGRFRTNRKHTPGGSNRPRRQHDELSIAVARYYARSR